MSEAKGSLAEKPTFRRVPLERVKELKDLSGTKQQFVDPLFEMWHEIHQQFPEARGIEQRAVNEAMRERQVIAGLSRLGSETWQENKVEGVVHEKWQEPVAGVYMAILGAAQEITPEGVNRIQQARMLRGDAETRFMTLSRLYDDMVEEILKPGCIGRLLGKQRKTINDIVSLEEKIVASLEKTSKA